MMGQRKEPRAYVNQQPMDITLSRTGKPNERAADTHPHSAPASFLSFLQPPLFQVSSVTLCWCHLSTQPTHPPTVGAACIIRVNLCSLAPPSFWHPDVFTWAWLLQVEGEFSCPAYELCHRRSLCCVAPAVPFLTLHWARFIWNYQGCFFHFSVNTTLLTLALSTLQAGCTQASSALKVSHQC